jgi:sugar-specific transcriptional regulator TrmB
MLHAALEQAGLSPREAKTYLALLELGQSTVGAIVKKTNIPSSKIYEVLDRLMQKALVSYTIVKRQKHFQAAQPDRILQAMDEQRNTVAAALPKLLEKQRLGKNKQEVEMYEGFLAVTKLYFRLIDNAKEKEVYCSFSLGEEHSDPKAVQFYSKLLIKRAEKKLKTFILSKKLNKKIYAKMYTPEVISKADIHYTNFNFPQGITILKDTVVMISWNPEPTAIVINSSTLAEQYRTFFFELYDKSST